jgi:hypothetical protein
MKNNKINSSNKIGIETLKEEKIKWKLKLIIDHRNKKMKKIN